MLSASPKGSFENRALPPLDLLALTSPSACLHGKCLSSTDSSCFKKPSLRFWYTRNTSQGARRFHKDIFIWVWLKKPAPKWNPGKWKNGPKPALILSHKKRAGHPSNICCPSLPPRALRPGTPASERAGTCGQCIERSGGQSLRNQSLQNTWLVCSELLDEFQTAISN